MSLVDYASSSDEEGDRDAVTDDIEAEEEQEPKVPEQFAEEKHQPIRASTDQSPATKLHPPIPHNTSHNNQRPATTVNRLGQELSKESEPPALKLPDAAFLLSSPALPSNVANTSDHFSRVAVAMAENASRKREINNSSSSSSSYTHHKVSKGNLPHVKRVPDTVGGNLLPPQLSGRSNVVTEDITKLFLKRNVNSSSE